MFTLIFNKSGLHAAAGRLEPESGAWSPQMFCNIVSQFIGDESKGRSPLPADTGGIIAPDSVGETYDWHEGGLVEDPGENSWVNEVELEELPVEEFWIHSGGSKSASKAAVDRKSGVIVLVLYVLRRNVNQALLSKMMSIDQERAIRHVELILMETFTKSLIWVCDFPTRTSKK